MCDISKNNQKVDKFSVIDQCFDIGILLNLFGKYHVSDIYRTRSVFIEFDCPCTQYYPLEFCTDLAILHECILSPL